MSLGMRMRCWPRWQHELGHEHEHALWAGPRATTSKRYAVCMCVARGTPVAASSAVRP